MGRYLSSEGIISLQSAFTRLVETHSHTSTSPNLRLLKCTTVVLPVVFLVGVGYLAHLTLSYTPLGFPLLLLPLVAATMLFSRWVFRRVEETESVAAKQRDELHLLSSMSAAASRPIRLDGLLQEALDGVIDITGADRGLVCVLSDDESELLHVACRNVPDDLIGPLKKVKLEDDAIGATAVSTRQPVYVPDTSTDQRLTKKNGLPGPHSLASIPLISEGRVRGVMAVVAPVPDAFSQVQIQFLLTLGGQLAAAIQTAQLRQQVEDYAVQEERERIAREMHDGLAQVLGYINVKTSAISRLLADGKVDDARHEIVGIREACRDVYGDVRQSILGLRLASVAPGAAAGSLSEYAASFSEISGINVSIEGFEDRHNFDLEASAEIQLLRIVQEALENVRKHSGASSAKLIADHNHERLLFRVEDNGSGFDVGGAARNGRRHFGLQTMSERASSVGGAVDVVSAPGSGTRVEISVPIRSAVSV